MAGSRPVALVGALVAVLALVSACSSGSPGGAAVQGDSLYHGIVSAEPTPLPDAILTDTSGQPYNLREHAEGKLTLLYLGYTNCPDICPAHMANIAAALKRLPASTVRRINVVFITTDPDRDTPAVMRKWLDHFDPNFAGLTSSQDNLDAVQRALGRNIAVKQDTADGGYTVGHAAAVLAFTGDGKPHIEYAPGTSVDDLAHDLALLTKGWKNP